MPLASCHTRHLASFVSGSTKLSINVKSGHLSVNGPAARAEHANSRQTQEQQQQQQKEGEEGAEQQMMVAARKAILLPV